MDSNRYLKAGIGLLIPLAIGLFGFLALRRTNQLEYTPRHTENVHYEVGYDRPPERSPSNSEHCVICLEENNESNSRTLRCGHKLHRNCLTQLRRKRIKLCPVCRATI